MRAFRFRLESVLSVRRFELERSRAELARSQRSAAAAEERQTAWRQRAHEAGEDLALRLADGMPAGV